MFVYSWEGVTLALLLLLLWFLGDCIRGAKCANGVFVCWWIGVCGLLIIGSISLTLCVCGVEGLFPGACCHGCVWSCVLVLVGSLRGVGSSTPRNVSLIVPYIANFYLILPLPVFNS